MDAAPTQRLAHSRQRLLGTGDRNRQSLPDRLGTAAPLRGRGLEPAQRAVDPERIRGAHQFSAALQKRRDGVTQVRLRQNNASARPHGGQIVCSGGGEKVDLVDAELGKVAPELLLYDICHRAHHHQALATLWRLRQIGHHAGQALVFALGESRFDARTAECGNTQSIVVLALQSRSSIRQIELDHL